MTRAAVIVPVYNGEATVAQAIDSALAQRFDGGMRVVAVNDGSTDSTWRVLERYGSRITLVSQPNRGLAAARNAGAAVSDGEYLAFLDADDRWLPEHLAKSCAALDKNPKAALAFSDVMAVDSDGRTIGPSHAQRAPTLQDLLSRGWGIFPSAVVMRRSVFDQCGGFCEQFPKVAFEDAYMWLLARERGEFEYLAEPLVVYRVSPFPTLADKYEPGRKIFIRLLHRRYGRSARPLIRVHATYFSRSLVQKALLQMDAGDRRGALLTWLRVLRLKPLYFFNPRNLRLVFRTRNLGRLFKILLSV